MPYIGNQPGTGVRSRFIYTATASQTTFTGADNNSKTLKYSDADYIDVYLNGVCLVPVTDYTATSKTSVVLIQAASLNDTLEVVAYDIATISDTVSKADGGTFEANVTFAAAADIITETLGTDNVRLGENAGDSIASGGANNVTIGKNAGTAITTGKKATLIGAEAGEALVDGDNNVAIGYQALTADTNGEKSVAVGTFALMTQDQSSLTDTHNTAVGHAAGTAVDTGRYNTLIGSLAGTAITNASGNVALGYAALTANTTGEFNTALGREALEANLGADNNTAVGFRAGTAVTSGGITAVGYLAGAALETGIGNVFMGELSGTAVTSNNNTAVGSQALSSAVGGHSNSSFGHDAGRLATGSRNTFIGNDAGSTATSVDDSVIIGSGAGSTATMTGHDNVIVGASAGMQITSGARNTLLGTAAGSNSVNLVTGTENIMIGHSVRGNATGISNCIVMGTDVTAVGDSNFTFGTGSTDSNIVHGATSITAPSDERYKEEIASSTAGLSFINDLRPVTFKWKKEKDVPSDHEAYVEGSDTRVMLSKGETNHGFIAQEVKAAIDAHSEIKDGFKMWSEDQRYDDDGNVIADGRQRVAPSELIPILTKAVQELSAKNDALETRIAALEAG